MNTRVSSSLADRMLRALRLDPSLYREVAASGGSTRQAVLVLLLAAVSTGLVHGAWFAIRWVEYNYWSDVYVPWYEMGAAGRAASGIAIGASIRMAGIVAVAYTAAWFIWALGFRAVGRRLSASSRQAPGFQQVARAIAFAQLPAVVGGLTFLLILAGGFFLGYESLFGLGLFRDLFARVAWIALVPAWVLLGTFLAIREALNLSSGQALAALAIVAVALTTLLGLILTAVTVILVAGGADPVYLQDDLPLAGLTSDEIVALLIKTRLVGLTTDGLEFNLGLGLSRALVWRLLDVLAAAL